ncbi:MAG: hypothetical protein HW380_3644 [Magnetococcales bacterium]|nr:hypothetical protein [Magnetococcales bacterium]HIJ85329.1 hypothetical protein [Magnetococcales bacterium]
MPRLSESGSLVRAEMAIQADVREGTLFRGWVVGPGDSRNVFKMAVGFAAFLVVFILNKTFILNHFYVDGAYLLDSGFFADLMYRNEFNPRVATILGGFVYNGNHFSLLHNLLNIISYIVPVEAILYYAIFQGLVYSSLTAAIFAVFYNSYDLNDHVTLTLAFIASVLFAFTGVAVVCVTYPHYEAIMSGMAILFLVFFFKKQYFYATLFFIACLSVREDSGFHLFCVLAVYLMYNLMTGKPWQDQKVLMGYTTASLFYSILAFAIQKFYFDAGGTFKHVYMDGHDDLSWLTWGHVWSRLEKYSISLDYLWMPFVVLAIWAIIVRKPIFLLGFLAQIPWFGLHVFSTGGISELGTYRLFPFLVAFAWPFLVSAVDCKGKLDQRLSRFYITFAILLFSLSMSGIDELWYNARGFVHRFLPKEYSVNAYSSLRDQFVQGVFGEYILVDHSVASLAPRAFQHHQVLGNQKDGQRVDMLIYWKNNHFQGNEIHKFTERADFKYLYRVVDTNVEILSNTVSSELK